MSNSEGLKIDTGRTPVIKTYHVLTDEPILVIFLRLLR